MLALPPAPAPARPRMLLVATALVCAAGTMMFAGMLGVWYSVRESLGGMTVDWLPDGVVIPEVATNVMVFGMLFCSVMVQWAVFAIADSNRRDTAIALTLTVLFGLAVFNGQAYVYGQIGAPLADSEFGTLYFALTGTFLAALIAGVLFAGVAAFRSLGGRYTSKRHEGIAAVALFWHFLTVAFIAVWFTVYVWK
jgi:cytochrome c oxidase subunit III